MTKETNPLTALKPAIGIVSETAGYVAVIISLILAIKDRGIGPLPRTSAFLLILFTTSALCIWRWSQIAQKKTGIDSSEINKGNPKRSVPILDYFIQPLLSANKNNYILPLWRRRVETTALISLSLLTIGWAKIKFPAVWAEINPPDILPISDCATSTASVLIADFYATGVEKGAFEQRISNEMVRQIEGMEICRLHKEIRSPQQALDTLEKGNALIIIWGVSEPSSTDAHIIVRNWDILEEVIWGFKSDEKFQKTESEHIAFLVQYIHALFMFLDGQTSQAQAELTQGLGTAQEQDWANKYPEDLADAYELLGEIASGSTGAESEEPTFLSLSTSVDAYTKALELNPNLDNALLNRGSVCLRIGNHECALQDFNTLINKGSYLSAEAYYNRSLLQPTRKEAEADLESAIMANPKSGYIYRAATRTDWGDFDGAISDYKNAIKLNPKNCYLYHRLGLVLLKNEQFELSVQTYQEAQICLEENVYGEEDRKAFTDELIDYCSSHQAACQVIDEIIAILKKD